MDHRERRNRDQNNPPTSVVCSTARSRVEGAADVEKRLHEVALDQPRGEAKDADAVEANELAFAVAIACLRLRGVVDGAIDFDDEAMRRNEEVYDVGRKWVLPSDADAEAAMTNCVPEDSFRLGGSLLLLASEECELTEE